MTRDDQITQQPWDSVPSTGGAPTHRAGTTPLVADTGEHLALTPVVQGVNPDPGTRLAATVLGEEIIPAVAQGMPMQARELLAVFDAFVAAFGYLPDRAWVRAFMLPFRNAKVQLLRTGTHAEAHGLPPGDGQLLALAEGVIEATRERISCWPVQVRVPDWVEPKLVAVVLARCGFGEKGGGRSRTLTVDTIERMLAYPGQLADDLAKSDELASSHGVRRFEDKIEVLRQHAQQLQRSDEKWRKAIAASRKTGGVPADQTRVVVSVKNTGDEPVRARLRVAKGEDGDVVYVEPVPEEQADRTAGGE